MKKLLLILMLLPLFGFSSTLDYTHYEGELIFKVTVKNLITLLYTSNEDVRIVMAKGKYVSPSQGLYIKNVTNHKYVISKKQGFVAMYINKDDKELTRITKELEPFVSGLYEDELGSGFSYTFKNGDKMYMVAITEEKSLNLMKVYLTEIVNEQSR